MSEVVVSTVHNNDVIMSAMASQIIGVSHHLFRRRSKKTSKLHVTGLYEGNPPVTGGIPSQRPVTQKMFPFDDVIMPCWWLSRQDQIQCRSCSLTHIRDTRPKLFDSSPPGHHFADDIFRWILWMKNVVFWLKFHWSLFLWTKLKISQQF